MTTVQCYLPRHAFALIELADVRAVAKEWGLPSVRFERSDYKTPPSMTRLTCDIAPAVMIVACFMNLARTASRKRDTAMLLDCANAVKTIFDGIATARPDVAVRTAANEKSDSKA